MQPSQKTAPGSRAGGRAPGPRGAAAPAPRWEAAAAGTGSARGRSPASGGARANGMDAGTRRRGAFGKHVGGNGYAKAFLLEGSLFPTQRAGLAGQDHANTAAAVVLNSKICFKRQRIQQQLAAPPCSSVQLWLARKRSES